MKRYGEGDFLSVLRKSEIAITAAATAQVGRMHLCTGTSANYTVTLPPAAQCREQWLGFRMGDLTALSKLVTLDGNASETIDGALTRVMWAGEVAFLYCDGSNWFKLHGRALPMLGRLGLSADVAIANATVTKVLLDRNDIDNTGLMVSTGSSQITVQRPGTYRLIGKGAWNGIAGIAGGRLLTIVYKTNTSGTNMASGEISGAATTNFGTPTAIDVVTLAAADVILLAMYQSSGGSGNALGQSGNGGCSLIVEELPTW